MIQIKRRDGSLITEIDAPDQKSAVVKAVADKTNLNCADLTRADLNYANLYCANLNCADLNCANLTRADLNCADLNYADLNCADLNYADLTRANLTGADLTGANLNCANLTRANLNGANLNGAYLRGASLNGAKINWQSHDLIAELLKRAAGEDVDKRKIAGLILVSRDWCWDKFLGIDEPLRDWALDELAKWVQDGDGAPECLTSRKVKPE